MLYDWAGEKDHAGMSSRGVRSIEVDLRDEVIDIGDEKGIRRWA